MSEKTLKEMLNPQNKKVHVCYAIGEEPKKGKMCCFYELEESYITLCRYDGDYVNTKVSKVEYITDNVCVVEDDENIFLVKVIRYK